MLHIFGVGKLHALISLLRKLTEFALPGQIYRPERSCPPISHFDACVECPSWLRKYIKICMSGKAVHINGYSRKDGTEMLRSGKTVCETKRKFFMPFLREGGETPECS